MANVQPSLKLTHDGALTVLTAAVAKAQATKAPQCIAIVDGGGHLMAFVRMVAFVGGGSVLVGWASFVWVERPLTRWARRRSVRVRP